MTQSYHVASTALAALLALSSITPAGAITDTAFTYSNAKTGYLALLTMAFAPDSTTTTDNDWFNSWAGNSLTGNGCFNARLTLPQGAKITQVRVMYARAAFLKLIATDRETGTSAFLASILRSHPHTIRVGFTHALPTPYEVDNNKVQLGVGVCVVTGETFYGARITYTYSSAGD